MFSLLTYDNRYLLACRQLFQRENIHKTVNLERISSHFVVRESESLLASATISLYQLWMARGPSLDVASQHILILEIVNYVGATGC